MKTRYSYEEKNGKFICYFGKVKFSEAKNKDMAEDWLYTRTGGKLGKLYVEPPKIRTEEEIQVAELQAEIDKVEVTLTKDQIENWKQVLVQKVGIDAMFFPPKTVQYFKNKMEEEIAMSLVLQKRIFGGMK